MMRTRWLLAFGPMVHLLASCGGGIQGGINDTSPPLQPPMNGITGIVTKGVISGATVTVTDPEGAEYEIRQGGPTGPDGQVVRPLPRLRSPPASRRR
ncbi:MAG: hypothetical protein U5O39_09070 [Gammaproteobacteria bacterium]|nr:hypothetical protein [Gammaproteobacteria bacterium]